MIYGTITENETTEKKVTTTSQYTYPLLRDTSETEFQSIISVVAYFRIDEIKVNCLCMSCV